eukprot:159506_1
MMKSLALLLLILLTQVSARKKQRKVMKCGVATVVQPDRVVVFKTLDIEKNYNYTITITNCVNDNIVLVDTHSKAQFPFALPSDRDKHIGWMELLPDTEYEIRAIEKHHTAVESFTVDVDCPIKSPPCSFNNQTIEAEQTGNVTCPQNHHVKGKDNTTTEQPVSCLLGGKFEKDPQCVDNKLAQQIDEITNFELQHGDVFVGEIVGMIIGCALMGGALIYLVWMVISALIQNGGNDNNNNNNNNNNKSVPVDDQTP